MTTHPTIDRSNGRTTRTNGHNGHIPTITLPEWATRQTIPTQPAAAGQPGLAAPAREPMDPAKKRQLDDELETSARHAGYMRRGFYVVVLGVALAGQVTGAVEALGIPLLAAIPAVAALEIGGVVVMQNADVRRRLGERATGSRILSAGIATWAVAFNWMAHDKKLLAGFFAGMSALGYLVWLMHTENQRRDRLRATGDLPPTTPAYELFGHWVMHPWLTRRARSLAKQDARLGLYSSLEAARQERERAKRVKAISRVMRQEIRRQADPAAAAIALEVFEMDEIAVRLQQGADYDGLTALVAARMNPNALVNGTRAHLVGASGMHPADAPQARPAGAFRRLLAAFGVRPAGALETHPAASGVRPGDALQTQLTAFGMRPAGALGTHPAASGVRPGDALQTRSTASRVRPADAPETHLGASGMRPAGALETHPNASGMRLGSASGTHPNASGLHLPDAPLDAFADAPGASQGASADASGDALLDAPADAPGASSGSGADAPQTRVRPRPVLPLKRASNGAGQSRVDPNVARLLKHAERAEKTLSIREVQKLLNVGAPKAKALMLAAGLLSADNNKEGN